MNRILIKSEKRNPIIDKVNESKYHKRQPIRQTEISSLTCRTILLVKRPLVLVPFMLLTTASLIHLFWLPFQRYLKQGFHCLIGTSDRNEDENSRKRIHFFRINPNFNP
jgi:hypothetical protein